MEVTTTNPPDKQPNVIGWPAGRTPTAPKGFTVSLYADRLDHPRWVYVLPNGDVLVAEANTVVSERDLQEMSPEELAQRREAKTKGSSANRITLPDGWLLVADDAADRIWRVTYTGK